MAQALVDLKKSVDAASSPGRRNKAPAAKGRGKATARPHPVPADEEEEITPPVSHASLMRELHLASYQDKNAALSFLRQRGKGAIEKIANQLFSVSNGDCWNCADGAGETVWCEGCRTKIINASYKLNSFTIQHIVGDSAPFK